MLFQHSEDKTKIDENTLNLSNVWQAKIAGTSLEITGDRATGGLGL